MFKKNFKKYDVVTKDHAEAFGSLHLNIEPDQYKDPLNKKVCSDEYALSYSGQSISDRFRRGTESERDLQIAETVNTYTLKEEITVYRGVCEYVFDTMKENAKGIKGVDFLEKGFLFTSLVKGCEMNAKKHLRIIVPAGIHAVYTGNLNGEGWYEVVIQHGAKMKYLGTDKEGYITLKVLETE